MKKGDIIRVTSSGYDYEGNAVCKVDNFVIFVEGLLLNETADVKIYKLSKSYAFGEIISITVKSCDRVLPNCKAYDKCGGCDFMHTSYENQKQIKQDIVVNELNRKNLSCIKVHKVVGMDEPWSYRNKVSVPIRRINGKNMIGFYEKKSHNIIEFEKCTVQTDVSNRIINTISKVLKNGDLSCYDEFRHTGLIRHVVIRNTVKNEYMVVIVVTKQDKSLDLLKNILISDYPEIKSIILNVNDKKTNVILSDENITIYGEDYINDYYQNKVFKISPNSFFQVNHQQALKLYDKAIELASINDEALIDAYCGVGTISIFASDKIKKAIGVDIAKSSIEDAIENAKLNNLENVVYLNGRAEELIEDIISKEKNASVIVDPPRKGCDIKFLDSIINNNVYGMVYISCNHNTLIRDIEYLMAHGYTCSEMYLYDMFPQTKHIECVSLITKNK